MTNLRVTQIFNGQLYVSSASGAFRLSSVGSGTLTFHGRTYRLSVGGLSYGFTFGGSQTDLYGRVRNIHRPSDIEGVYGAGSAGAAVVHGAQAVVLTAQPTPYRRLAVPLVWVVHAVPPLSVATIEPKTPAAAQAVVLTQSTAKRRAVVGLV